MASENTHTNAVRNGGTETTEHGSVDRKSTFSVKVAVNGGVEPQDSFTTQTEQKQSTVAEHGRSAASLTTELSEPAVGSEVNCPGGNYVQASTLPPQTEEETRKTTANAPVTPVVPPRGGRRRQLRPEDRCCCCCSVKFERQGRSFNRRAVFTFTTSATVQWVFPNCVVHDKSFLCENCAQAIRSKCKRKQTGKRSLWLQPPAPKQSDGRDKKKKKDRRMGKKSKAAQLVSKSCYRAALKTLWSAKGARKPMMDFWSRQLKEEMKMLSRHRGSPFHQKVSNTKALLSFPWRRCLNWAQDKAPLVTTCLQSLFPDITTLTKIGHPLSEEQAQTVLERRAVVALSIPLFTRNIWKNNFLQAALGAELRLQGCSGSAIDTLNTMGLCQNKDTVRLLLQRLRYGKRTNGRQRIKLKGEPMSDVEEEDIEEEEEVELEIEDDDDEEEDDEEEEEEEEDIELAVEEEVVEEDGEVGVQEEEEDDQAANDKEETKRRRKKAKKQRKEEKRKERGKWKAEGREEEEEEEDDEGSEQKKRRVVVERLGGDTQILDDLTFQLPKTL